MKSTNGALLYISKTDTGWLFISAEEDVPKDTWDAALLAAGIDSQATSDFDYRIEDGVHVWEFTLEANARKSDR